MYLLRLYFLGVYLMSMEGSQVSLLVRVVLCHQVKRIKKKLKKEVT